MSSTIFGLAIIKRDSSRNPCLRLKRFIRATRVSVLNTPGLRNRWVAFHGEEQIGIADDDEPLIKACLDPRAESRPVHRRFDRAEAG